jgi:hypothetical protein
MLALSHSTTVEVEYVSSSKRRAIILAVNLRAVEQRPLHIQTAF